MCATQNCCGFITNDIHHPQQHHYTILVIISVHTLCIECSLHTTHVNCFFSQSSNILLREASVCCQCWRSWRRKIIIFLIVLTVVAVSVEYTFLIKVEECKYIRESVDSLCRDGVDWPRLPYIRNFHTHPNVEGLNLFGYQIMVAWFVTEQ